VNAIEDRFAPPSPADVVRLIEENPLAWIVSIGAGDFCATLLPLRAITGAHDRVEKLVGHCARTNRLVEVLRRDPRAAILFLGPQGYISPSWMRDRTQAPTWNYASVQFLVEVEFCEDSALDDMLSDLVGAMEAGRPRAWSPAEMGERYRQLARRIIGFHAPVRSSRAKFKLGQDERDDVFADITRALEEQGPRELLQWMERCNPGRPAR